MEMDVEGNDGGQINANANGGAGADKVPHEVVTRVDERAHGGKHGSDEEIAIAQRMLEERTAEYSADVEAYRARISHLESMLARFRIRLNGSLSSALLLEAEDVDRAPLMV